MPAPIPPDERNLHQLAGRFSQLSRLGMLPFPNREGVTIIVKITNPQWAAACLRLLLLHSEPSAQIIAVPERRDLPSLRHLFSEDDPIAFMPYEPGVDLAGKALSEAATPFAALLEDRVLVTPHWLSRLIWPFYDDDNVMIASPKSPAEALDGRQNVPCQSLEDLYRFVSDNQHKEYGTWHAVPVFTGPCLLFRTSLLNAIGGVDPLLRNRAAKTADWCLRARQIGGKLALCEDVYVHALHSLDSAGFSSREWDPFCAKWGLPEMDKNLSVLAARDFASLPLLPPSPLRKEHFSPPLVTAIVLLRDDAERERWIHFQENQTYVNVHWIFIRPGIDGFAGWGFPGEKSTWQADAILLHETGDWIRGLEAALKLAKGEYVVYFSAGPNYPPDYMERMVDLLFREPSDIAAAASLCESSDIAAAASLCEQESGPVRPSSQPPPFPLPCIAHRHAEDIGSFLVDRSSLFLLPRSSQRIVYWHDEKNEDWIVGGGEE